MRMRFVVLLAVAWVGVCCGQPGNLEPGQGTSSPTTAPATPLTWTYPAEEERGVWLTSNEMLESKEKIERKLDALRNANFNTVLICAWFRGYVAWPGSKEFAQYPQFGGEDRLGWIIEQCHRRGLAAHLWLEYGFYAWHTPDASMQKSMGPVLDKHPHLLAMDREGNRFLHNPKWGDYYAMCPSNPQSHRLLAEMATEGAARYPADGINLDRIRYPERDWCACEYCRKAIKDETGLEIDRLPAERWTAWKRQRTVQAVATIRKAVHAVRPGLPITSYVVGPDEMDSRGQGWDLWAKEGLVEAVAVSMYGGRIDATAAKAIQRLGGDRSRLIYALSCDGPSQTYLENIQRSRQFGGLGQYTWYAKEVLDDVAGLREGPYAKPARSRMREGAAVAD